MKECGNERFETACFMRVGSYRGEDEQTRKQGVGGSVRVSFMGRSSRRGDGGAAGVCRCGQVKGEGVKQEDGRGHNCLTWLGRC